jgi:tetratricopeptide (TPR) repeat protein
MEMANRALSLPHAKADATEAATAAAPEPEDRNLAPEVALQRYVSSLATVEPSSPEEQRIRGRCISSALKMNPPPEVPAQASRHLARGQAALEMAKSTSDFNDAAEELERAVRLAPWWADGYHELGAAYEKATNYQQSMNAYQLYLAAAPTAPDAKEVKSKIYKLEYAAEREQKQSIEKSMQQRQQSARMLAMQGLWADKSGTMWQASLQSGLFVAQRSGYREGDILYNGSVRAEVVVQGRGH